MSHGFYTDAQWGELPSVTCSEYQGIRYMHLGDTPWVQGCMRMRKPFHVELDYVQRMLAWLLWHDVHDATHISSLHTVQLGLGAASLTKFCARTLDTHNTVVELNHQVINTCHIWFQLPPADEKHHIVQADAEHWLAQPGRAATCDALMVDLYDHEAAAPVLDSAAFYAACHALLKPGGHITINLFGRMNSYAQSLKQITTVFGAGATLAFKPTKEGNTVVLAQKQPVQSLALDLVRSRSEAIEQQWGLKASRWSKLMRNV